MSDNKVLLQRFDATKVTNFNESLRLEGLQPNKTKSNLHPKVLAKLKELKSLNDR